AAAEEALRQALAEKADRLQVKALPGGQVEVAGAVATAEDKVAVSQCLQRLNHCTCVANRLAVNTAFGTAAGTLPQAVAEMPRPSSITLPPARVTSLPAP